MGIKHSTLADDPGLIDGDDWDADHVIDGEVLFPAIADPTAPAAGNGLLYAADIGGRIMPKWIGPSGVDFPLQPHMGLNNISIWRGGATTTIATTLAVIGSMSYSGVASSVQIPALATSSLLNQSQRSRLLTSTTAGNLTSVRTNTNRLTRGNAAGIGGYHYAGRFALATMNAAQRFFFGLWNGTGNPTNLDWTTDTASARVGLVAMSNTGNWRLAHNAAGAAPTLIDLGATFPINNTDIMELTLFCAPNGSSIGYRVRNLSTGATATGTLSTNLPADTIFLGPMAVMTNNSAAAAVSFDILAVYAETDF